LRGRSRHTPPVQCQAHYPHVAKTRGRNPRAQSTGAIIAQSTTRSQPRAINCATVGDAPACTSPPRRNLTNRSILPYKLLWCGRVASGDLIEVLRESVRISNIKIILFAKTFLAPQMQASRRPPGAPGAGLGPPGPS